MDTLHPRIAYLNRSRRLGVEFEMTLPLVGRGSGADIQKVLAEVLTANGLPAVSRPYDHTPLPDGIEFAVEHDHSIRGESRYEGIQWFPIEIKSRILHGIDDWEAVVPKMLDIARYMGARVNASCGHHVHVSLDEVRERPIVARSLYNLVHRIEPVLYGLLIPSRRSTGYARPLTTGARFLHPCDTLAELQRSLLFWDRHTGFNLMPLLETTAPHVEFRYHHGTLDPEQARHWLRLLLRLVDHACARKCHGAEERIANDRHGIERVLLSIGLKPNSKIYTKVSPDLRETGRALLKRWRRFNPDALTSSTQLQAAVTSGSA